MIDGIKGEKDKKERCTICGFNLKEIRANILQCEGCGTTRDVTLERCNL